MAVYSTLAAVDLGSNSFHLQVARVVGDQIYPLDSLREPVRLGAGLGKDKRLDEASQQRAIDCLKRFGERLRSFNPQAVRVAGTNTFRVAKNAPAFLKQAQAALGFPIEIVAGKEEARLIYLGVAHGLPVSQARRLVVDIGGGSTECIIGRGLEPLRLASLYMGCVSYSLRYFADGKITRGALRRAELAVRSELQPIAASFKREGWQGAYASSGSARALAEILRLNGLTDPNENAGITPQGLEQLRTLLLKTGDMQKLNLEGLRADRIPVLPGGFAIMSAVLSELEIPRIEIASGAMREGLLYDLLGRVQHHDMRDATVEQFMQRYHVDSKQAHRIEHLARALYQRFTADMTPAMPALAEDDHTPQLLTWAAKLHEIGISVAYSGYHKHSAYIIENADMPGFSKMEQSRIAQLVLAHRRSLKKSNFLLNNAGAERQDWKAVMALRLAALFYRNRADIAVPAIDARLHADTLQLTLERDWLARNPLTATALLEEIAEWREAGMTLDIPALHQTGNEAEAEAA